MQTLDSMADLITLPLIVMPMPKNSALARREREVQNLKL
jgi:hypothetical protein